MASAVFFDLSGVLYSRDGALPGAIDAVTQLRRRGVPMRFVTNTSRRDREQVCADLRAFGFDIPAEEIFTAPGAVQAYLEHHGHRAYCLVHANLDAEFAPFAVAEDQAPTAVVVGDAAERFDYYHLNRAFDALLKGAELIAVGDNRYFRLGDQFMLDAGPFVKALEYAADVQATVIGKPSATFFQQVLASIHQPPEDVLMIGDDAIGDVEGALKAGLQGCLVQTGKYRAGDEDSIGVDGALLATDVLEAVERFVD